MNQREDYYHNFAKDQALDFISINRLQELLSTGDFITKIKMEGSKC